MEFISYLSFFILLNILVFVISVPILDYLFVIILVLAISFNYRVSIEKKISTCVKIYVVLYIIELIIAIKLAVVEFSAFKNDVSYYACMLVLIRGVSLIIAYLVNRYNMMLKKNFSIPIFYYFAILIILAGYLCLFIMIPEKENIDMYNFKTICVTLSVVNILYIFLDEKIYKVFVISHEKNVLEQQNIAYEKQIEVINQSNEAIRIMKHDMINHLTMLNELYDKGNKADIKPYISNLIYDIENEAYSNSNNFVIDSIINFKLSRIKKEEANISLDINVPNALNISAKDLTSVIGNLLDNAIYAMLNTKEKRIDINISYKMDNLIILIDNSCSGNLIYEKGNLKTTKSVANSHGLGLLSVKKILKKYDGEIKTTFTENIFEVSVIIPATSN